MRRNQLIRVVLLKMICLAWPVGCYDPVTIPIGETCHPSDPACAALDFDEDGVPNGVDHFPLDDRCSEETREHCGSCDRACAPNFTCKESTCIPAEMERCDGLDNDQDDVIDESLIPPSASLNRGVCEGLTRRCDGDRGWVDPMTDAISDYEQEELSCDGLDNDCDGQVDELLSAPLATPQRGVCQDSRLICEGALGWLAPDRRLTIEHYEVNESQCDGLDNDCDGRVDERVDGDPCQTGRVGRCGAGVTQCVMGTEICEPIAEPITELCNGIDDDCDDVLDEELTPPIDREAAGVCQHPPGRCERGQWVLSSAEVLPTYEVVELTCDGLDNDCDYFVDEGLIAEPCVISGQIGPCADGLSICQAGEEVCVSSHQPGVEECNGIDDDCDGGIDEEVTLELYANQRGVCLGLTQTCDQGNLNNAEPWRLTQYEFEESTCDGLDNDCDGIIDENIISISCETRALGRCQNGESLCINGIIECLSPLPQDEVCDGLDNDCDGAVDEELTAPLTPLTLGVCAGMRQRCGGNEGWLLPPSADTYEVEEISCDLLDNDCDGYVDELLVMPQDPNPALRGVCLAQHLICEAGQARTPTPVELTLQIPAYEVSEVSCDGLDNDCDGQVDEQIEMNPCVTELSGICREGSQVCIEGEARCLPNISPSAERCDGLDDDCDGEVDELLTAGPCAQGVGACLRAGETRCELGEFICDARAGDPQDERCNAIDDDCDGVIDERFDLAGVNCSMGVGSCARQGVWSCDLGVLSCDAVAGPSLDERCDGEDNDCDGAVDEDFFNLARPCVAGVGACEVRGFWRCSPIGDLQCAGGPRAPELERCDGLDNDCDGEADEHIIAERCDSLDNDCDGLVDESASAEACDLEDNDCDGVIDESPCAPCLDATEGCPTLTWSTLPAGDYLIGGERADEQPISAVRLPDFQLSDEITVSQYQSCVRSGFCTPAGIGGDCNAGRADRGEHPVNCISWLQAHEYAFWVGGRLPSEAEWEYAARSAGLSAPTPWGGAEVTCAYALLRDDNGYACGLNETTLIRAPRNSAGVSEQGVWNLLGNVAEWVEDDYRDSYTELPISGRAYCDPGGCAAQGDKVYRGGGWRVDVSEVDNRKRFSAFYLLKSAELGFRVARYGP